MLLAFRRSLLLALATALAGAHPLVAQRVLDPLGDASLPRPGQVRIGMGGRWDWFDSRLPASAGGARVALGDGVFGDPVGDRVSGFVTAPLRRLANDTALLITAGTVRGGLEARNWSVPISLEIGITRWLAVQATVPVVQPFSSAFVRPNPSGTFANLGRNPALGTAAAAQAANLQNQQLLQQVSSARTALTAARPDCFTATPAATCAAALAAAERLLRTANDLGLVFQSSRPFVPLAGSRVDTLIAGQFAALNAAVRGVTGGTTDPITARPAYAAARMGFADFQAMVLGAGFDSLGPRRRILLGDASAGATVTLFDTFGATDSARLAAHGFRIRSSVRGLVVLGTGQVPVANQWVDQGSGTNGRAIDLRWTTDVMLDRRFWFSVAAQRRNWNDEPLPVGTIMVSDITTPFGTVQPGLPSMPIIVDPDAGWMRRRGAETTVDVVPRLVLSDYVAIHGAYRYRRRAADTFEASGNVADIAGPGRRPAGLDGELSLGGTEQRVGLGVTYSTLAAKRKEARGVPVEVSYLHQQVIAGTNLPRMTSDAVQMRWYWPVRR